MAGVSGSVSTEMGMHTEPLTGRDIKTKFRLENEGGFAYHFARDVDFNRRAEVDCADIDSTEINRRIRELMDSGHGSIVLRNPGAKHSLIVGILNRMNIIVDGSLGYFRLRPAGRAECADFRPRRLVVRREHDGPASAWSRRTPAPPSAPRCAAAIWCARVRSARAPGSTRRAAPSSSAATPAPSPAS